MERRCIRCGACCEAVRPPSYLLGGDGRCAALYYETLDGVRVAGCRVQFDKPFRCVIYPQADDVLPPTCGYRKGG